MFSRFKAYLRDLLDFPHQFWVLTAGIFIYVGAAALAFPFEAIYLRQNLGTSMTMIGVVFGLVPFAVMPVQFWGGQLTDKLGRRVVIMLSVLVGVVWFVGFAFVTEVWQVALLVAFESALGWPLFQTASNAMIADLLPADRRQTGFGVSRAAMNFGVVVGPVAAGQALRLGVSYRSLFLAAAAGCVLMVVMMAIWIRESRPPGVGQRAARHVDHKGRSGYRIVFHDKVFVVFCLAAVLPVFCIGNFGSIYAVYITDFLGVPSGTWALPAHPQRPDRGRHPVSRWSTRLRHRNRMLLLAVSSALLAVGIGGSAFAGPVWSLVAFIVGPEPRGDAALAGGLGRGGRPRAGTGARALHGRVDRGVERRRGARPGVRRLGHGQLRRPRGVRGPARGRAGRRRRRSWRWRRGGAGGARRGRRRPGRARSVVARASAPAARQSPRRQHVERVLQVARVLFFDDEDVLEGAAQAVLLQHLGLGHALAVARDRVELALEVVLEHGLGVGGDVHVADVHGRHAAEPVDLVGERDGVRVLLGGVHDAAPR